MSTFDTEVFEIDGREYCYCTADGHDSLLIRDENGDSLLPPLSGRWSDLGAVSSLEGAREVAREWEAAR